MPSTYAHYRLGQEVRKSLVGVEKNIIDTNSDLFNIGLHGPDILFYYHPLSSNAVSRIGYGLHEKTGYDFFSNAAKVIKESKIENEYEAHLAYVYGFICHFALDTTCHGYIDEKINASKISHSEIEVEFDRELMVEDGFNPITHRLTNHIIPDDRNALIIKDFYSGVSQEQVKKALEGMISNNNLLIAPSNLKRKLIYGLLRVTGNYKEMHGLIVNYKKNENCNDSTQKLKELYKEARRLAIRLIIEYKCYLSGIEDLDEVYELTFAGKKQKKSLKQGEFINEVQIN